MKIQSSKPSEKAWPFIIASVVFACFIFLAFFYSPLPAASPVAATPARQTVSATPIPEEWVENARLTEGTIVGGILLVLIILFGTFRSLHMAGIQTTGLFHKKHNRS